MKHHSKTKKFGRKRKVRKALMASLARALILNDQITTTLAKAKALRPMIEKMVTKARKGTLAERRALLSSLSNNTDVVNRLIDDIAPRFTDRDGGYTRIVKLPLRKSDAAPMAIIQFVELEETKKETKKEAKKEATETKPKKKTAKKAVKKAVKKSAKKAAKKSTKKSEEAKAEVATS